MVITDNDVNFIIIITQNLVFIIVPVDVFLEYFLYFFKAEALLLHDITILKVSQPTVEDISN